MTQPTQPDSCRDCPLYGVGKGFVLGSGDPRSAKYAVILEAPGKQEIEYLVPKEEEEIRARDYPELDRRFIRVGMPVVGPTGFALQNWIWAKIGIKREETFIDNTIRCLPPRSKTGVQYPIGKVKQAAELACRQYDRLHLFRPDTVVFSLHPAGLLREVTPLPLVVKDWERVRDFTAAGRRVLALLGGKATQAFMRYGGNVTRWRSHYQELTAEWLRTYKSQFEYHGKKRVAAVVDDVFDGPVVSKTRKRRKKDADI